MNNLPAYEFMVQHIVDYAMQNRRSHIDKIRFKFKVPKHFKFDNMVDFPHEFPHGYELNDWTTNRKRGIVMIEMVKPFSTQEIDLRNHS